MRAGERNRRTMELGLLACDVEQGINISVRILNCEERKTKVGLGL